jgi:hypothetical protein
MTDTPTTHGTGITHLECQVCCRQSATLTVNVVTGICDNCAEVTTTLPKREV